MLFARAMLALLALPGVVAFGVPLLWLLGQRNVVPAHPLGWVLLAAGTVALLACVRDFYVTGRGTLAPWAPPKVLVVVGLYRHSRNPMYLAVLLILLGWAWALSSWALLGYAAVVAAAFQLRVVRGEEPWLARTYGQGWEQYRRQVPRWW